MSQHDYIIDNQLAPAFRADLNSALNAIVSQNSGLTAPTATYANMFWYDTANDLLKIRNEANSAWITVGTIDQTNNVFNPNFLPATQAEAEAGTDNTKGMTPLRVAQEIAAKAIPTTAQVGSAMAGLAAGAVGDYSFLWRSGTLAYAYGSTLAGSSLQPASAGPSPSGGTVSGTWMCLGSINSGASTTGAVTLWRRIS